jgi:hypothetical protein
MSSFFLTFVDGRPREAGVLVALLASLVAIAAGGGHIHALAGFGTSWLLWAAAALGLWLWGEDPHSVAGIAGRAARAAAEAALRVLPLVVPTDPAMAALDRAMQKILSEINDISFHPPFALSVERLAAPRLLPVPRARGA